MKRMFVARGLYAKRNVIPWALLFAAACSDGGHQPGGELPDGSGGAAGAVDSGCTSAGRCASMAGARDAMAGRGSNAGGDMPNSGDAGGAAVSAGSTSTGGIGSDEGGTSGAAGGALCGAVSGGCNDQSFGGAAGRIGVGGSSAGGSSGDGTAGSSVVAGGSGGAPGGGGAFAGDASGGSLTVAGGGVGGWLGGAGAGAGGNAGSNGGATAGGSAGSSGSSGATGTCVGSCSAVSLDACASTPQCTLGGSCMNFAGAAPCNQNVNATSCSAAQWCVWLGDPLGCKVDPQKCPSLYPNQAACVSGGGTNGCAWVSSCSGTLDCSAIQDQQQCGNTAGCGWKDGKPKLVLSTTALNVAAHCPSSPSFDPQEIVLTNPGQSSLTWRLITGPSAVGVSPNTGTLAAGAQVAVTVAPSFFLLGSNATPGHDYRTALLTFGTTIPGDTAQTVTLTLSNDGYIVRPPDPINFGAVPLGTSSTRSVAWASVLPPNVTLVSNNPDFALNGSSPLPNGTWSLTFTPSMSGAESTTLTMGSAGSCVYPPNTVTASANN